MEGTQETRDKTADYLARTLKRPAGLAKLTFSIYSAMMKAGFTDKQAMEITQWLVAMAIGLGGMTD